MRLPGILIRLVIAVAIALPLGAAAQSQGAAKAKNVVLFLADAGGISTINAASLHGHGAPQKLFIQRMPNIGLSDTSPVGSYVTDSAAGMTAIVTGQKTRNNVVSQNADAQPEVRDGAPLKTILEYAEERGLSTGIITNDSLTGATPAATYAHANDRDMTAVIFQQLFAPRFGDGPEIAIGAGRASIARALTAVGTDIDALAQSKGRPVLSTLDAFKEDTERAIVVLDSGDYDVQATVARAIRILSRNPKGYFLMVEWDSHTDVVDEGLEHLLALDRTIEQTARTVGPDTLLLFTADHSFDMRVRGGSTSAPLLDGLPAAVETARAERSRGLTTRSIRMENSHTGEEVLAAAQGPGAERVRGYLPNTELFTIMMDALGWPVN